MPSHIQRNHHLMEIMISKSGLRMAAINVINLTIRHEGHHPFEIIYRNSPNFLLLIALPVSGESLRVSCGIVWQASAVFDYRVLSCLLLSLRMYKTSFRYSIYIYFWSSSFRSMYLSFPDIVATLYDILEKTVFESHTRATKADEASGRNVAFSPETRRSC